MMTVFLRSMICILLIVLFSVNVCASSRRYDAAAVITMRDSKPCFSFPQDNEIRKRPYLFGSLSVSNIGPVDGLWWEISIVSVARKGLLEPNNPATCIKYGVLPPGTKNIKPAEPLLQNTPYEVFIAVFSNSSEGYLYERNFLSEFCLVRDAKGNTIAVDAIWDSNAKEMKCLKPGESPKRSFWQKLFGR
jgi:hypothetical protein